MPNSSEMDFSNVDPPLCTSCHRQAWPGLYSNQGKYHCAGEQCRANKPADVVPSCFKCGRETWNGLVRGLNQIAKGKGFMCKVCWVLESPPDDQGRWARWFPGRSKAYPNASPSDQHAKASVQYLNAAA